MNLNIKGKFKSIAFGCFDTIVKSTGDFVVEVSSNERIVTLVGFDDHLSYKYIMIGASPTDIGLTNGSLIDQPNNTPLIYGGTNC